ncbi:MAG: sel1 repeat family protein [Burkholderiales bacterium]|nr:sel1 repeat family protein [Burkholderiales bacterium]
MDRLRRGRARCARGGARGRTRGGRLRAGGLCGGADGLSPRGHGRQPARAVQSRDDALPRRGRGGRSGAGARLAETIGRRRLPQAQYNLGLLYERGSHVERSQRQATAWFRRAAEQGHADAQLAVATQYFLGRGTPRDYAQAARWYEAAAETGDAAAQYITASLYERGTGVAQDLRRALDWYARAGRQGDLTAQEKAKEIARRLRGGD